MTKSPKAVLSLSGSLIMRIKFYDYFLRFRLIRTRHREIIRKGVILKLAEVLGLSFILLSVFTTGEELPEESSFTFLSGISVCLMYSEEPA